MSKNFVSFNLKAKKKCDADGMILHSVNPKFRSKSDNITLPQFSKFNINSDSIYEKYKSVTNRIEEIKGKKIQKNANHYLEGVLSFSFDKFAKNKDEFRAKAPKLIEEYGKNIAAEYGFEYLGFSLHFDESKTEHDTGKPIIDKKTGLPELNVHAHVSFVNFDFNTNKSRFREYQQKFISKRKIPNLHFVKMQDMANDVFEKSLGFVRGLSKSITKKPHLEKHEFMQKIIDDSEKKLSDLNTKYKEKQKKIESYDQVLREKDIKIDSLDLEISQKDIILKSLNDNLKGLIEKFNVRLTHFVKNLLKRDLKAIEKDLDKIETVVDETSAISYEAAENMSKNTNEISKKHSITNRKIKTPKK